MVARIWNKLVQIIEFYLYKIRYSLHSSKYVDLLEISNLKSSRLPARLLANCSKGVRENSFFLAGAQITFTTQFETLEFDVIYKSRCNIKNMSSVATSGIDIYQKVDKGYSWIKCIAPHMPYSMGVKDTIELPPGKKDIVIYLPGYARIEKILIKKDSHYSDFEFQENRSIAVYGSSVTHGCAASRPGLSYVNILSRDYGYKVFNFGFSASAKGEVEIIEYIASLGTGIIVVEYDHNATVEELRNTHRDVYKTIRGKNKNCLIIFMSRFSGGLSIPRMEEKERIGIIKNTVEYAIHSGDENVRFLDGSQVFAHNKDEAFTDDRHPNDLGMNRIAMEIDKLIII